MFVETTENGWEQFENLFKNKGTLWGSFHSIIFEDTYACIEFTCGLLQGGVDSNGDWIVKDPHRIRATIHDCLGRGLNLRYNDTVSAPGYIAFDKAGFSVSCMDSVGFALTLQGSEVEINYISSTNSQSNNNIKKVYDRKPITLD